MSLDSPKGNITNSDQRSSDLLQRLIGSAKDVSSDSRIDNQRQYLTEQTLKERETERVGNHKYYELRDKWSRYVRNFVWAMLIYQALLTLFIGFGWFNFKDYQLFLNLAIGENFAQIIGMGVIVAKFLFSKK